MDLFISRTREASKKRLNEDLAAVVVEAGVVFAQNFRYTAPTFVYPFNACHKKPFVEKMLRMKRDSLPSRRHSRAASTPTAISPAIRRDNDRAMMPHGEQRTADGLHGAARISLWDYESSEKLQKMREIALRRPKMRLADDVAPFLLYLQTS
ncbi:hypothetical protein G5I_08580 [Acromyrmex echinatior]|uniref:Uncharacterized protein n=1 Tax=Acromyrmex echinatior TaxID=103372 RepID=F4WRX5_ACREC|nr:hypothetical protein G5I_08580 [Acromyrmex echinatior]